jgi:glycoside/pentoside/hexuronide:cation symporter, GPH family
MSVMTPNSRTRVTLTSFRFFLALLTTLVLSTITLPIVGSLGNDQFAWTSTTAIFGVVSVATMLVVFFGTKERVTAATESDSSAKRPLGPTLALLFRNKFFLLAAGMFIAFNLMSGLWSAAGVYYATDVLGNAALFGIISIAGIVPSLVGIPFMPALMGRFGKRRLILIGIVVLLVGALLPLFAPENFGLVLVGLVIRGLGMVPMTAGQYALVADVVDYGEWRNHVRTDGLIYSAVTFGQKVGAGFGAAIVGWALAIGGYTAGAAQQSDGSIQAILAVFIYLPVVLIILSGIIVYFFTVERYSLQIQAYLKGQAEK